MATAFPQGLHEVVHGMLDGYRLVGDERRSISDRRFAVISVIAFQHCAQERGRRRLYAWQ
jgi:hypothetical protein